MLGLESFITLAMLLGGAGIAASAGGAVLNALVNYMLVNKGCVTAKEIAEILAGRKPTPGGGVSVSDPDDEDKKRRVQETLQNDFRIHTVDISVVKGHGIVAYVSVDAQRRVGANDLRYLAARIGLPVAIAYVRVCTNCGAMTPLLELKTCPGCGTPFPARKGATPPNSQHVISTGSHLTFETSDDLRKLLKPTEYLVVDGSNLATKQGEQGEKVAQMWTIKKVMEQVEGHIAGYKIFVGSRFRHIVDDDEAFKQLENEGKIFTGGQGCDDDYIILGEADRMNAIILTRDLYAKEGALNKDHPEYDSEKMRVARDVIAKYPWTLDKTRFIGHIVYPMEQRITFYRHLPAQPQPAPNEQASVVQDDVRKPVESRDPFREPEQEGGALPPMVLPTPEPPAILRKVCPSCNERVRPGQYCNRCGAPLIEGLPIPIDDACPSCGGIVDRWTLRCGDCGAQYETWICDRCGSPIDAQSERCDACGTRYAWRQWRDERRRAARRV